MSGEPQEPVGVELFEYDLLFRSRHQPLQEWCAGFEVDDDKLPIASSLGWID